MNESPKSEQLSGLGQALRPGDKGAVDLVAAVNQQLASAAAVNQQALAGGAVGASLPPELDYILSLAVKQHQQQQLLQHQRQLQQLQHLQHLQQIQQQQHQNQQRQQHQHQHQQHQQASAAVAAAAAAAAAAFQQHQQQAPNPHHQHHHAAAVAAAAAAVQQHNPHLNNTTTNNHQQQHHHNHRRQYNPAATLHYLATNECRVIDYRGHRIAAFLSTPNPAMLHHLHRTGQQAPKPNQTEHLLCLPQAFEVFLKHLVGGLHTVYTKLKRLDIVPIVCNVEQVRILRGLGAIQPGVNRCKLLSTHDFDILFKDCTTARPGRPPKRSPVGDALSSASGSPTRDDSRSGSPAQSELDSAGSLIGAHNNNSNNNNDTNGNSRTQLHQNSQHGSATSLALASSVNEAANLSSSNLLNNSGLANNNNNNNQPSIDLSALAQHLNGGAGVGVGASVSRATTSPTAVTTGSGSMNPLGALLDTSLLAGKLAQQQHLLGTATTTATAPSSTAESHPNSSASSRGNNCTSTSLLNNGTNSLFSTLSQQQAMLAASVQNATIPTSTSPPSYTSSHQSAAAAAAAANLYQSPSLLNDVWLLLALVQQQLNQQIQTPGAQAASSLAAGGLPNASQLLQQQLQAQLQLLQQQQQLAGAESATPTNLVHGQSSKPGSPTGAALATINDGNRARSTSVEAAETSDARRLHETDRQLVSSRRKSSKQSNQDRRHAAAAASPPTSSLDSEASSPGARSPPGAQLNRPSNTDERSALASYSFDEDDDEVGAGGVKQLAVPRRPSGHKRSANQRDRSRSAKRVATAGEAEYGARGVAQEAGANEYEADTNEGAERLSCGDNNMLSRRSYEAAVVEDEAGDNQRRAKRAKRSLLDAQNNIGKRNFGFPNEMSAVAAAAHEADDEQDDEADEAGAGEEPSRQTKATVEGDHWPTGDNEDSAQERIEFDSTAATQQVCALDASSDAGQQARQ